MTKCLPSPSLHFGALFVPAYLFKQKVVYVFIAFSILSRRFAKGKGLRLLFGISFAFRLSRTEVCCNPQLCSTGGTIQVLSNNRHTHRYAQLPFSPHLNHSFLDQFSGETLSLHECSRLLVFEIQSSVNGNLSCRSIELDT